jgi:ATP-binding cassette subfamily F protein 3
MSILTIQDVAKSFGSKEIFAGVSFKVEPHDRIGLVGANGTGKSTLLNLITGIELPDHGTIERGRGLRVGYLTQTAEFSHTRTLREELLAVFAHVRAWEDELHALGAQMASPQVFENAAEYERLLERYADLQTRIEVAGGYNYAYRVDQVLAGLEFTREQQDAPATQLSGGQQTRAALGRLLLQEPDLLLLDEPTNHLDLKALEWLEEYLGGWKGALIVVAHDRYFLDKVVERVLELSYGRLEEYPGNYTRYLQLRAERLALRRKTYEVQREYIARTEEFIRRYKAGQRSKEARGRQKLLDRLERVERPRDEQVMKFRLETNVDSGEMVLETQRLIVGYGAARAQPSPARSSAGRSSAGGSLASRSPLLQGEGAVSLVRVPDLEVRRGERIGLMGPNGSGKTTLLRTIVGQVQPLGGQVRLGHNVQIGYYAQTHENLNSYNTVVDEIRSVSAMSEDAARTFLGRFLFSGDDVYKPIGALSGGERSRVALAKLTLLGANCLILDEPTNHLDLPSRQFLEEMLGDFDGTLIFVSHDRYFIDTLATRVWVITGGELTSYLGNYSAYRARQKALAARATADASPEPARRERSGKARQPVEDAGQRAVRQIEDEITALERQLADMEAALAAASAAADVARIAEVGSAYSAAKERLDALYAEWSEVAS